MTTATASVRSGPLTASELLEFNKNGFLRPGRIINDEQVGILRDAVEVARVRERKEGREYDLLDPSMWPEDTRLPPEPGKSVGFLFNLWLWNDEVRQVSFDATLASWASQLLGARQVRLLEDNALFKDPGQGGTLQWHQDYPYWPLAQPNAVTAWIALDDVDQENGGMKMVPGSHLSGETLPASFGTGTTYLKDLRPSTVVGIRDPEELGWPVETIVLSAGEVSFHHALTWHASGPNTSERFRRSIVVRFVADGTIWLGSWRYDYNYSDDEVGIAKGEPLGGRYFPIVPF